ncbi:ATP-grasp domain-containing protein [Dactylosporangium sp. NBC_01737]|uniref:ATP-binding protein n=1 Tax=Dactylosporangium sp. NBC_01737 TaxID=2975959 RepID=UPI002E1019F1|nr:ATP-grasp domain-containing protein [Dactylosporangium sp. NBC_01737]
MLIIGEYRVERLVRSLRHLGARDIAVCTAVDLNGHLDDGVRQVPLARTSAGLAATLNAIQPELVLANLEPTNEQLLPELAACGGWWRGTGRRMPVHSPDFATIACDKVAFHREAQRHGWPVPRGEACLDADQLLGSAVRLGLPLVVKEARSMPGTGRHYVTAEVELRDLAASVRYPVLAQAALRGEEYGIELMTTTGATVTWPVAAFGPLDPACRPMRRGRVMPAGLPAHVQADLAAFISEVVASAQPQGPWQIDFVVDDSETLQVLEINGRLSGMTNLGLAATGVDPHAVHALSSVVDGHLPAVRPRWIALELPAPRNGPIIAPPGIDLTVNEGSETERGVRYAGYRRLVLCLDRSDMDISTIQMLTPLVSRAALESLVARGAVGLRDWTPLTIRGRRR